MGIITVKVITRSSQNKVEKIGDVYKVWVTKVPEKGKANELVLKLLAEFFRVSISQVEIIKGANSSTKLIRIDLG